MHVIERSVALDLFDAVEGDLFRYPIEELPPRLYVLRLVVVVTSRPDLTLLRRLNPNVDVFREPVDDLMAFRERSSLLELEGEVKLLQDVKAVHDPVVFFDQGGIDAPLLGDNADQIGELPMVVEIVSRHAARRPRTPEKIFLYSCCQTRERLAVGAAHRRTPLSSSRGQAPPPGFQPTDRCC